jgi:hypothetical protein
MLHYHTGGYELLAFIESTEESRARETDCKLMLLLRLWHISTVGSMKKYLHVVVIQYIRIEATCCIQISFRSLAGIHTRQPSEVKL